MDLVFVMSPVCWVHTTRNTDGLATSVAVQLQCSVHMFITVIRREVHHQLLCASLMTLLKHLVTDQRTNFPVSLATRVAEVLTAVETIPSRTT